MSPIQFDTIVPQLTPDTQIETDWTGALAGLASTLKKTLLVAHLTSAGSAAAGEVHQITSEAKAISLWGKGSELAVMAAAFLKNSPRTPLYGMAYAEGGAAVAASNTVTLATNASGTGTLTVWVAGRRFQVGIASGDTPTVVGDLIVAAINAHPNLPVTAANVTGVVTLTARCKGPQGNTISYRSEITASGMTSTDAADQLASGATAGDPTSDLAAAEGERFHLVALNTHDDSTTLATLSAHTEKQSTPAVQKWGIGVVGHSVTRSNAETLATADDSYRSQIAWLQAGEEPCFEVAAAFAALRARRDPRQSLDNQVLKGISAPSDKTKWPTSADIEAALTGGVTPLRPLENGDVEVVRSIITRQTATIAFRDHNKAELSDFIDESLIAKFKARAQGKPLKTASAPGTPTTITPLRATALLNETLLAADNQDYIQGVEDSKDAGNNFAEVNASDSNRLDLAFDFYPVGLAHFIAMKKTYRTTPV